MNNQKSTMNGMQTQQGFEGLYLLKDASNEEQLTNTPAVSHLEKIMMHLPSCEDSGPVRPGQRRLSVRFIPSSPVYVHITMRPGDDTEKSDAGTRLEPIPPRSSPPRKPAKIGFYLEAPLARRVKLAADFTHWEKSPMEMANFSGGLWGIVVPLAPGRYSYRFIVDGQWCKNMPSINGPANIFGTVVR